MTQSKHSPGPWQQHRHGAIIAADGQIVAQYFTAPGYQDGNMIIAAPDMYEALENIVLFYEPQTGSDGRILESARAALAKAEGRQP